MQSRCLLAARQAGKSTVTAAMAMHEALFNPPALVLLLSPSLRQSSELLRKVVGFYRTLKDQAVPVCHQWTLVSDERQTGPETGRSIDADPPP
jgi:hypothetical protein